MECNEKQSGRYQALLVDLGGLPPLPPPPPSPAGSESTLAISLSAGWNWVSLNVQPTNPALSALLTTSPALTTGDLIKSSFSFSEWTGNGWIGSLNTWSASQTHLLKMASAATFTATGALLSSVSVTSGWNWIAFASPTDLLSVESITHSGGFVDDDVLKSSQAFTVYGGGNGARWSGSLTTLSLGTGYLLKCANGGTVTFGSSSRRRLDPSVAKVSSSPADKLYGPPIVGSTSASLSISLSDADGSPRQTGRVAAFSADGQLLGMQTAHADGHFYLSVANPLDAVGSRGSRGASATEVSLEHADDDGSVTKIPTKYSYVANDVKQLRTSLR